MTLQDPIASPVLQASRPQARVLGALPGVVPGPGGEEGGAGQHMEGINIIYLESGPTGWSDVCLLKSVFYFLSNVVGLLLSFD